MSFYTFHQLHKFLKERKLGKILTKIHLDKKDQYFIIDTIFHNMHISIFKEQWNKNRLIHITQGSNDNDKCSIYFKIDKYNNIKEPKGFKYNQNEFSDTSSRRSKCTSKNINFIIAALRNLIN